MADNCGRLAAACSALADWLLAALLLLLLSLVRVPGGHCSGPPHILWWRWR